MEDAEEFTSLAAAIAGARNRAGLLQKEAAERVGMSTRAWQDWERGIGDPVSHLGDIEDALGLRRGFFVAQLTVLERMIQIESWLERVEKKVDENSECLRDIYGFLKITRE